MTTAAADTRGNIYVGGSFVSIGGQTRTNIAKLSGTSGAADSSWNSSIGVGVQEIYQVATDAGGNVSASGALSYEAGHQISYNVTSLVRLTGSTGAVDPTWNHQSPILGTVLATDVSNNVYVSEGGIPVKILSSSGAADQSWNPLPNGAVSAIAIDVSANVYVAGGFTSIGGQSRTGVAALSPVEGAETLTSSMNPSYFGQNIILTATVTGQSPTGTVTFNDNGGAICPAVALSAGSATCATSTLTVGAHVLTAVYSGDENNAALTSASLTQQVTDSVASSPESITGLWYDPKFSGLGFNFQMAPVGLLVTYYGWDATGNRLWLTSNIGPTALTQSTPITLNMSYTTGGTFNNPQHNVAAWGTLSINFSSCHSATAVLSGKDGTQNLNLQQLTGVVGLPSC